MRRLLVIVLIISAVPCLTFGQATPQKTASMPSNAAQVQTPPAKPGPEHKRLEIWVGDWTYAGDEKATSFQPARTFTGKASVRPILGGLFVEWHAEESNGKAWQEIDGYDAAAKRFVWHSFNADGSVEVVTYGIDGNTVSMSGTAVLGGKRAKTRGTCVFAADMTSFNEKYEVSLDGKTWILSAEYKFTKVRAQGVVPSNADVEQAMSRFLTAFDNLDWPAFRDCFSESPTVFFPFPQAAQRAEGEAFDKTWRSFFDSARKQAAGRGKTAPPFMEIKPKDMRIDRVTDEVAVVTFHLGTEPRLNRRTFVLQKFPNGWKIVHLHASYLTPD